MFELHPRLTVLTTGGTIDKVYFDARSAYQVGEPEIGRIMRDLDVALDYEIIPLMRKDSLELTAEDRALIRRTIAEHENDRFVLTHGTDTMVETAQALAGLSACTIVLTGALNPARFLGSDAVFNIGCAIAAVQLLPHGVFIAMNGRIWDPRNVRKNLEANRFEALTEASPRA